MRILAAAAIGVLVLACNKGTDRPGPTRERDAPRGWVGHASETSIPHATQRPIAWHEPANSEAAIASRGTAAWLVDAYGGTWQVDVDPVLHVPRAMSGSGIPFVIESASDDELARAALALVEAQPYLFGARELVFAGAVVDPNVIMIQLAQRYHGLPVIGGHLGLTISHGKLVLVQGDIYPIADLDPTPLIDRGTAIRAAGTAIEIAPRPGDRDDARLVVVPERAPGSVHYRLAWEVDAWRGPRHAIAYVDAHVYEYAGRATNEVDERTVGDRVITVPASYLRLSSARGQAMTGAGGDFRFSGMPKFQDGALAEISPLTVTAGLRGRFVDVHNLSGPDATFVGMLMPEKQYELVWDEARSLPEERDTFHMVNRTNRFVSTVFPTLPWMDEPLPANVNHRYTCNAFWNGSSINFFIEGGGCNNTARIFDVVAHEWGHGLDQNAPGGAIDGALGEFIGDLVSFVQTKSPLLGLGFFKDGAPVRDLEDPEYRCYDPRKREVHDAGHMLGAVVWDIHQDLERIGFTGEPLKRLMLLPIAGAQSRAQWYREMLAVDDDDGNLANGTPHECLIYNQFKAHSCAGTRWPGIPDEDPPGCRTVR